MPKGEARPTTTYAIPRADQERLREDLYAAEAVDEPIGGPYEAWRVKLTMDGSKAVAILYTSGKLVLSGKAPAFDRLQSYLDGAGRRLPPKISAPSSDAATDMPVETEPHIGTDEAGKGDFFGPMVTAGVFVDARTAQILRTLGVRDSKTVSDKELRGLAASVREVVDEGHRVALTLAPRRYNELYSQMRSEGKNLNSMLAWTHTRVIEDLIKTGLRPAYVLSDQFGDKRYIERRLLVDTRLSGVRVLQMHRAEADVGVAAASILARDGFLRWIAQASTTLGMAVPKGAGPPVIVAARALVAKHGADSLKDYAKVSFKTMEKVLAP